MKLAEEVQQIADKFFSGRRALSYEEVHKALGEAVEITAKRCAEIAQKANMTPGEYAHDAIRREFLGER